MKKRIVVIGAGFAGLSTGYELTRNGFDVTIIEEKDYEGGLCTTFNKDGYLFDVGGHRLYTKSEKIFNFLNDLLGKEAFIERKRISRIYMRNKFFEYPLKLFNVIINQKPVIIFSIAYDFIIIQLKSAFSRKKKAGEPGNFEDWIISRFGRTLYNIYFKEYTEKVWKEAPKNLHKELAERRISFTNIRQVVARLFGIGAKEDVRTYITDLYYPKYGIGDVAKGLVKGIESSGGKIYLNTKVTGFSGNGDKVVKYIECQNLENKFEKIEADYFLSTIPLTSLLFLLKKDRMINIEAQTIERLKYKSIICLYLMVDIKLSFPDTWLYIPETKYIIFRIVNFSNWSPYMAPEGKTSLCLEISIDTKNIDYDAVYKKAIEDIESLGLLKKENIEGYFFKYFAHAYPVYLTDYAEVLSEVDEHMKLFKNLLSYGRQGAFNYTTMDNTLRIGLEVADHIMKMQEVQNVHIYDEKFSFTNNKFQEY